MMIVCTSILIMNITITMNIIMMNIAMGIIITMNIATGIIITMNIAMGIIIMMNIIITDMGKKVDTATDTGIITTITTPTLIRPR